MQRDNRAHSLGGNGQVPKSSKRGQSHAHGFSVSACATLVTGPPAQSNHLAMPDSRVEGRSRRQENRLHFSVRRKVWPCFCNLHTLQNPEGSSFGRQTCHLGNGGNRKCSSGSSTPCLQSVCSGHREATVGTCPGPGTAELLRQKLRRQTQYKPREVTRSPWGKWPIFQIQEHVFFSLHYCVLSFRSRFSCRHGAFTKEPVAWGGRRGSVWPQPLPMIQACAVERNGKGIHVDSFSNRYVLSSVLCQPLKNCPSEQQVEVISVTVQQVTVTSWQLLPSV